jgi:hypothetical protein
MHRRRLPILVVLAVIVAILPLTFVQLAIAGGNSSETIEHIPFTFSMGPDRCSDIDTTVSGSGEYVNHIITRTFEDGSSHVRIESNAVGIATDSEGATYRFVYRNVLRASIPASGPPFTARGYDRFSLSGNGSADGLFVYYEADLVWDVPLGQGPPASEVLVKLIGNPACDPI